MTRTALAAALLLFAFAIPTVTGAPEQVTRPVPACPEDAVLLGTGDFEAGRWTGYTCGPAADDFTTEVTR